MNWNKAEIIKGGMHGESSVHMITLQKFRPHWNSVSEKYTSCVFVPLENMSFIYNQSKKYNLIHVFHNRTKSELTE